MTFHPMRPETIARRAREHAAERVANHRDVLARMREAAARDVARGITDSIFADMVAEHPDPCPVCETPIDPEVIP